jgi:uncharacterized paraquat-inducible protein A
MIYDHDLLLRAHKASINHRSQIEASHLCGCFHCRKTFEPSKIDEWVDDEETAMCPRCGIDSVIGDASGFPAVEPEFLSAMHRLWF